MKSIISHFLVAILFTLIGLLLGRSATLSNPKESEVIKKIIDRPLDKYAFETLQKTPIAKNEIKIDSVLDEEEKDFTPYLFTHSFDPTLSSRENKKITGQLNLPKGNGPFPLVIMFRGYVDPTIYQTGIGTRRGAEEFAKAGFITVAPDFLGYAGSDSESGNIFETRFQSYTTALSILENVDSIKEWDGKNIFIWGHSNGGQVALTTLAITGKTIPTVLWAPVTKPFPYSILYYTDDSEDKGKFLRSETAKFESLYDAEKYSYDNLINAISAPIQIHQGTGDDAVPFIWSTNFTQLMKSKEKEVEYFTYPGGDHNLMPGWDNAIERSTSFFRQFLVI